jgi:hypothetical protein
MKVLALSDTARIDPNPETTVFPQTWGVVKERPAIRKQFPVAAQYQIG